MGNLSHLHSNVIPQHDTTRPPFSKVLTFPNTLPFQLKQSTFVYVLLSVFLTTTQALCWTPAFLHHLLFATSIKVIVDFFFLYLSHTTSEYKLANPELFPLPSRAFANTNSTILLSVFWSAMYLLQSSYPIQVLKSASMIYCNSRFYHEYLSKKTLWWM